MQLRDRPCTESCPVDCCNWQLSGLARSWAKVTCHWLAVWSLRAMSACSSSGTGAQRRLSMVLILKNLHSQFMCFVWIWEKTEIISLYSTNWLVFITETECVYCAVRTGSLYIIQVMCFVWIWEQTAVISLYSINWLVFITETECIYCAVRTGSLYIIQVTCFVWIWEQTAIIFVYSFNWLVFEMAANCLPCAGITEYLYVM